MGWFQKLKKGLSKSTKKVSESIKSLSSLSSIIGKSKLDASSLEEVEEALISADLGIKPAARLAEAIRKHKFEGTVTQNSIAEALASAITEILQSVAKPLKVDPNNKPHVLILVGVNGSGKTTTAGKLAQQWQQKGKKVILAAADTFRAAAIEQLQIWGDRTGTKVISSNQGSDAAALVYSALQTAKNEQADILIVDTAGRLQNRLELMEELGKIVRVMKKIDNTAPHDSIIVLDGTVGQNALSQVRAFQEAASVTGLIVTKLDGSAKGGVVVALAEEFGLPVHAVGVGEKVDDLQPFDAEEFANALTGVNYNHN